MKAYSEIHESIQWNTWKYTVKYMKAYSKIHYVTWKASSPITACTRHCRGCLKLVQQCCINIPKHMNQCWMIKDECSCLEWSGHEEPLLILASVCTCSSWQVEFVFQTNQINLTEFITLPVQDNRDLYVIIANWQCFQSWGVFGPAQWVILHDIQVYFKVDVVHWLFMCVYLYVQLAVS